MKKILIIGAGFLQDFVIRKAKNMGYVTLAVDANPHAIGFRHADHYKVINIIDEESCLSYARKEKIDGVLTAATDYGVLTAARIAKEMHLPGLNYDVAQLIKNKYRVRNCLQTHKIDDSNPAYEVNENTDLETLSEKLTFPVMVKPCDGSGSRGASRVDLPKNFREACTIAISSSVIHRAEVEEFIFGEEYGVESLVLDGKANILGIMKKWMTSPPYYAELGHAIPSGLTISMETKVKSYITDAINALGINFGAVNMDILITPEGRVHIVDVGARMGGNMIGPHIIPYGTGIDYMAELIRNTVGDKTSVSVSKQPTAVASRLLAFEEGIVKQLPDFNKLEKEYAVEIFHHMHVGQHINEYHTNLDGCGYIIAKAKDLNKAVEHADTVLRIIKQSIF